MCTFQFIDQCICHHISLRIDFEDTSEEPARKLASAFVIGICICYTNRFLDNIGRANRDEIYNFYKYYSRYSDHSRKNDHVNTLPESIQLATLALTLRGS